MITVRRAVRKRCPYKDEDDHGLVTVTCPGDAPELHHLAGQIAALGSGPPISHEDFTRAVAGLLPPGATVATSWRTARWEVEVTEPGAGGDGMCAACGMALARCEWCGMTGQLDGGHKPERRPGWDGCYHEPCHDEQAALIRA